MKKILAFLFAACLASAFSHAQNKGEMYAGGALTFNGGTNTTKISSNGISQSEKTPLASVLSVTPSFGYFIADNLRLSASIGFESETQKAGNTKESTTGVLFGPEIAYYLRLADNLYYTPEAGLYLASVTSAAKANNTSDSVSMIGCSVRFNLAQFEYRLLSNIGIAVNLLELRYISVGKTIDGVKLSTGSFVYDFKTSVAVKYYF